jgi:hypothetical protein
MTVSSMSDESLLRYYEEVRSQVSADIRWGRRFMRTAVKDRANSLLAQIRRRQLSVTPIYWPHAQ